MHEVNSETRPVMNTEFFPRYSSQTTNSSLSSQNHRLPKLTLPTFSGDILEWQYFWESFENTIHSNHTLTDVQKFTYLQSLLDANAMNVINGLNLSSANYHKAVELLVNRFGKSHKIVNAYMKALLDLPAPSYTLDSIRNFSDKSEVYIRGLESLGQCQDTYGSLLIPVMLGKLPISVKSNITRENGNDDWTLGNLRKAIQREISIQEASTDGSESYDIPTASFHAGISKKNGYYVNKSKSINYSQSKMCTYCNDQHFPADCEKFTDSKSRMEIVKKRNLCFNCLGNHRISECRSKNTCRKCQRKHHTSLCNETSVQNSQSQNVTSNTENSTPIMHTSAKQENSTVFLKTAIAPIWSQNQCADAHILFDEGAQRSFMTQEIADKLNVKPDGKETLNISAFGNSDKNVRHMKKATVFLEADSGEKIPLQVLIVPTIAAPIQNNRRYISQQLHYLKGLKLAHPLSEDNSFDISLLIGADHYWDAIKDDIVRGDGPTAMSSKIGYLLSGPLTCTRVQRDSHMMHILSSHTKEDYDIERFWKLKSLGIQENDKLNTENRTSKNFHPVQSRKNVVSSKR
ncbi:Hypothetical predicted protein [Mytilus galloprovincialis]|uniref:DUF1758 domain-containing protein n=2 Tax=Mytilus galloprovincialis TaxID=29158 RepID=A0A8B6E8F2_MYTGA|nr:Hypothetical predicted protein [Mytilus galloprovincialis]